MNEKVLPRNQKQNGSCGYAKSIEEVDLHDFDD